jgi:hypothetical protein
MKTRLVALAALLIPSIALAQAPDPNDPNTPPPVVVEPAPEPPPAVIINPPPEAPRTVVVTPEYETYTDSWNAAVFTSGALLFAASYGTAVAVAASSEGDAIDRGNSRLYVPVVGPWLALNDRPDCPIENASCDRETTKKVLLVADGILQAGGVITMITGLLVPAEHRVLTRPARVSTKIHVAPSAAASGPGLLVFGRF